MLQSYFRSGWAFLIPYLAAYLLYAWLKWPVHAGGPGEGIVKGISESVGASSSLLPAPCSLLHLYWSLHVLHLLLGCLALRDWWRADQTVQIWDRLRPLLPWGFLMLLIAVPGIYLEFPSDPVVHLARITEWARTDQVLLHSSWEKSSYFLAYSLCASARNFLTSPGLLFYYTGMCLLWSWQNYRLALQLNFSRPVAFLFSALQLILYGNSAFSFHRYYGLSSTLVSLVGTVALVRIGLQFLQSRQKRPTLHTVVASSVLVILTGFSHVQGLVLTAVSLAALGLWKLSLRQGKALGVIAILLFIVSGVIFLTLRSASPGAPLSILRAQSWVNATGGFDFFNPASPSRHFAMDLLGTGGLVSIALGLVMLACKHPAGWLVAMPPVLLFLPATACPLALYLYSHNPDSIGVFSRALLALPLALPFAWLLSLITGPVAIQKRAAAIALVATLGLMVIPSRYSYNRFWQMLARPPDDLQAAALWRQGEPIYSLTNRETVNVIATAGTGYILRQHNVREVHYVRRLIQGADIPSAELPLITGFLEQYKADRKIIIIVPQVGLLTSPGSQVAQLSHHWLQQQVALDLAGTAEIEEWARLNGFIRTSRGDIAIWKKPSLQ